MAQKKGVSGKTHTRQQLNDYANQHNPNNKAYKANKANQANQESARAKRKANRKSNRFYDAGFIDGESYGWCDD